LIRDTGRLALDTNALDEEELAVGGIAVGAVGELAGEDAVVQDALLDDEVAGLAGGLSRSGGGEALLDEASGVARALFEPVREFVAH